MGKVSRPFEFSHHLLADHPPLQPCPVPTDPPPPADGKPRTDHLVDRRVPPLLPEEKRDEHDQREKSSRQMGKKKEDTRAEVSYQELSRAEHPLVT